MNSGAFPAVHAPVRRRRSSLEDPLKKLTLQLSESIVNAIKTLVSIGEAQSTNAFVEDAVRSSLRERRRARMYAAYEEAAKDPAFMADMNADLQAFDNTLRDGLPTR